VSRPRRYGRPSRPVIYARRLAALIVLGGGFALAGWAAALAVRSVDKPTPPPPATRAAKPAAPVLRIVFPEGFTRRQMAQRVTSVNAIARRKRKIRPRLSATRYLRLTAHGKVPAAFAREAKGKSLEGFLFPATYDFTAKTTTKQLVARQLEAFRRTWSKVDVRYARSKQLTPYDVLVIASMVERETVAPDERPLVAAVIYNRLKAGMPLGIDATIRYGLNVPGNEPLRQSQLQTDNPYNTRTRTGLTPTPIANPGLASIQAAAHPAKTNYLFFVRKPDKVHHFFTASEREFYAKSCQYGYSCG
jgi:UPF0755 protein